MHHDAPPAANDGTAGPVPAVPFRDAFLTWVRVGLLSFGGPAGQIAVMHRILVDEKRWVGERQFLHALNFCMLLPGPEAQQLATFLGWVLHRVRGGLAAGILFVLPGFLSILLLSAIYALFQGSPLVFSLFYGLKPAVVAIVVHALLRIGSRALHGRAHVLVAAAAFLAIFVLEIPFPLVVLGAGLVGWIAHRANPRLFALNLPGERDEDVHAPVARPSWRTSVLAASVCLLLWWLPIAILAVTTGLRSTWTQVGLFFSQAAVVTFGGAYAVLAFIAQQAVEAYGWLAPGEMLDGLGMAETTPGPLIQVVQFVGFMATFRDPGALDPLLAGVLGAVLTTWVTFVPCFLFIFAAAPWVEHLRGRRGLAAALSGITAAVVGVIFSLAVWFALHVLFTVVIEQRLAGMRLLVPELRTLDPGAALITLLSVIMLFVLKRGIVATLSVAAVAGLAWGVLFLR